MLLLDTLDDPYPTPQGSLKPDAGPAPSRYVPCETCRARGEVRGRGGWRFCLVCEGQGWKRREREPAWDAYLDLPLTEAAQLPRASGAAKPFSEDDGFGWERARHLYDRHGSYKELRRHLDWLSLAHPRLYLLVRRVVVDHEPRALDAATIADVKLGVVLIARRMRSVRVPAWLIERGNARENRTIEGLAAEGKTPGQIARELGMTREVVKRKLRKKRQRAIAAVSQ